MSADVIVEFTVTNVNVYREKYAGNAGKTARHYGAEVLANSSWEILDGETGLSSGATVHFSDHETALSWYSSPEYQQLVQARGLAMDGRFSLLDALPAPTGDEGASK